MNMLPLFRKPLPLPGKYFKGTFFLLFAALLFAAGCAVKPQASRGPLLWEENFNWEKTGIDETRWTKIPRGPSDWNRHMSDLDSLYQFRDGKLVLRGMVTPPLANDTAPVITGGIYTRNKKTFGFGRMEIHAKLNGARGAWPAFWMMPATGTWPNGGEIDIMERLNSDSFAYQTVHSNYTHVQGFRDNPPNHSTGPIDPHGFNTYIVEKYPDSLVFYINDRKTFSYPRIQTDKTGQFPFPESEYYLLLDMQLGGQWVGRFYPEDLPVEMEIDWVRFYALPGRNN